QIKGNKNMELTNILNKYSNILGNDYQNLGKTVGSGLRRRKILLSYNYKKGFDVIKLNILQLFLRKIFGFYSNTHLENVINKWVCIRRKDQWNNPLFDHRIQDIWKKTYTHKGLPSYSMILENKLALGSTPLEEMQVFCFAENHCDKVMSKEIGDW